MKKIIFTMLIIVALSTLGGCNAESDFDSDTSSVRRTQRSTATTSINTTQTTQNDTIDTTVEPSEPEEPQKVQLDPFEGLHFEVSGISPYCQIIINNVGCSMDVQMNVTYTLDKKYYANGEEAVITASIKNTDDYSLTTESRLFQVNNQPEYITSLENVDISIITSELEDFITSNTATAVRDGQSGYLYSNLLGCSVRSEMKSVDNVEKGDIYLSSIKANKVFSNQGYYNMLSFTYSATYTGRFSSGTIYSSISAVNIVKYPDGSIKWGTKNLDTMDFTAVGTDRSMENCITTLIMCNSVDYNISKISFE